MRAIWLIFHRELSAYFTSPLAYLIAGAFLLLTGITFNNDVLYALTIRPVDPALIPSLLTRVMVFFAPLLTMRLLAEENREGTLELLLTAPVSDFSIVLGKFLSAWAYYTFLLALTFVYQLVLVQITTPDLAHTIGAYVGVWLYGGATLAVGLFFSALTESQILAAFSSSITLLVLYYGESVGDIVSNIDLARIIFNLTLQGHFAPSFAVGVARGEDVVYYTGVMTVMLFITIRAVEARRWRYVHNSIWTIVSTLLLIGIVSVTYVMVQRAALVADITIDNRFTLNARTLEVLGRVQLSTRPVRITGFYRPDQLLERELDDQYYQLYESATNGFITREYINPLAEPARAAPFENALAQGIRVFVSFINPDGTIDLRTTTPVNRSEHQEQDMTEALARLLVSGNFIVYFERSLETLDPLDDSQNGMSLLNGYLQTNGFVTRSLELFTLAQRGEDIPRDASVVIIARPRRQPSEAEIAVLDRYLARGGRLFIAADFYPIAANFMAEGSAFNDYMWRTFGLRMYDAIVVDMQSSAQSPLDIVSAVVFSDHPAASSLNQENRPETATLFRIARPILVSQNPPVPNGSIIMTSELSWGETDTERVISRNEYSADEGRDIRPPLTTAAWARNNETDTRVLLVGDGDFLMNGQVFNPLGNTLFFLDSLGWLTGYTEVVQFAPRSFVTTPLIFVSVQQLDAIAVGTVIVMPALLLGLGGAVYLRRRWRK